MNIEANSDSNKKEKDAAKSIIRGFIASEPRNLSFSGDYQPNGPERPKVVMPFTDRGLSIDTSGQFHGQSISLNSTSHENKGKNDTNFNPNLARSTSKSPFARPPMQKSNSLPVGSSLQTASSSTSRQSKSFKSSYRPALSNNSKKVMEIFDDPPTLTFFEILLITLNVIIFCGICITLFVVLRIVLAVNYDFLSNVGTFGMEL